MNISLSDKEIQTIKLVADGKTAAEIGQILGLSRWTVQSRLTAIKDKAGVYKETALVATAIRNGWIQ